MEICHVTIYIELNNVVCRCASKFQLQKENKWRRKNKKIKNKKTTY